MNEITAEQERVLSKSLDEQEGDLRPGTLADLVEKVYRQRAFYLEAARRFGTPQYLLEERRLQEQIDRFVAAFAAPDLSAHPHYALKANPTLSMVQAIQRAGLRADASSGLELELALRCGFERIVLSGPAKTDDELRLALAHADKVTVHLDSFHELNRLDELAAVAGRHIDAGIRLNTQGHGLWTKFGIAIDALPELVQQADTARYVNLRGVQFHLSWNRRADGYLQTLGELGPLLGEHAPVEGWRFVDIGGGYYPEDDEAVYPWLTERGKFFAALAGQSDTGPPPDWDLQYLLQSVQPIEQMAQEILAAFRTQVAPTSPLAELWLEPGRYLANPAVHLLLQVADCKGSDIAITDGGTNLLGWERLEAEHCPLINLSHPGPDQQRCRVYGSLCTPHDLWGYTYYGTSLAIGDLLLLPAQGAYVQTLAQRFIKPICQTVVAETDGTLRLAEPAETFADRYPQFASAAEIL